MLKLVKSSVAVATLLGLGLMSPAMAQSSAEMAVRMQQLEEQVRQLMGQVEELSFEVKQLKAQGGQSKSGALEQPVQKQQAASQQKRLAAASAGAALPAEEDSGLQVIQSQPLAEAAPAAPQPEDGLNKAPGPTVLGSLDNSAAKNNDGGFQGKVLVPPSQQEPGDEAFIQQGAVEQGTLDGSAVDGGSDSIETVSLSPDTPESLYERSNESLLRRQFGDAEAGFSTFLSKYPDHSLAGSAQYWLGETYYAQGDFKRAAQNFLQGYKKYPKGRRAADSLLKLGISLNRLGQGEQACAAFMSVSGEYPKAVEARKRAQAEAKRAGCAS